MPTRTAPTVRPLRKGAVIAALAAGALAVASCGTGEDSPAAEGDVSPQQAASSTTTSAGSTGADSSGDVYASAVLRSPDGQDRGTAEFAQVGDKTLVTVEGTGLPPGFHGLHVHTTGVCEPDSANPTDPQERGAFLSAGGHLAGPEGAAGHPEHAGDLPALYVNRDGTARLITLTDRLDRELLLDDDGSAVMIHENSDNLANIPERYAPDGPDEETRKAGDGGSRVACGVAEERD